MADESPDIYNQVTLKNIDDEDFAFRVDNVGYIIKAGETRNFPKFMANLAVKHLVDKILNKKDPEGKLTSMAKKRSEVARKIVLGEEAFERPTVPTSEEIVEKMNRSDLETALTEPKVPQVAPGIVETPAAVTGDAVSEVTVNTAGEPVVPLVNVETNMAAGAAVLPVSDEPVEDTSGVPTPAQVAKYQNETKPKPEVFDQVEDEKKLPKRTEMMKYAKDTLKLDTSNKKIKERLDKLSDQELYDELQMGA
jgi:hypothetical protein